MTTTPHAGLAQRALVLAETGRHKEAAALFARHLAAEPTDTMSWSLLAHCRRELRDPEGALDATDQGLRHDPTDAYVWRIRALTRAGREGAASAAARASPVAMAQGRSGATGLLQAEGPPEQGDEVGALAAGERRRPFTEATVERAGALSTKYDAWARLLGVSGYGVQ
jgi:predicted Zn-dependent protease